MTACFFLVAMTSSWSSFGLADPFRASANGQLIDVTHGHASPCFADFWGTGHKDLLAGQFQAGAMRIYPNKSKSGPPQLGDSTYFQAGGSQAQVSFGCCVGFGPQFGDVDGDGVADVLSGSYTGGMVLFAGEQGGGFKPGVNLQDREGKDFNVGEGTSIALYDWDKDGKPDLISGTILGGVYYAHNLGGGVFDNPVALSAGQTTIEAFGGRPCAVDWDGDGVMDLFLGMESGRLQFYKGQSGGSHPDFENPLDVLPELGPRDTDPKLPEPSEGLVWNLKRPGMRPKPAAFDWNGDGKLDLVVGDVNVLFGKADNQTPEQKKQWADLRSKQLALQSKADLRYEAIKQRVLSKFGWQADRKLTPDESLKYSDQFSAFYAEDKAANDLDQQLTKLFEQMQPLNPPTDYHGFVWVFLRK